ncbi:chromate transporter-domain-containing protein [Clohesyomyces aquaticus]|uniref:Chromate transporter-domain-containing protein n=1 Tax=Clohesyomyces aquaticus TaxID=1231657 RepID=A0A1Y1ZGF7_9PLEO|nr:chromate transporter-domain-containing protein [Clohesyomyces aquaticus]
MAQPIAQHTTSTNTNPQDKDVEAFPQTAASARPLEEKDPSNITQTPSSASPQDPSQDPDSNDLTYNNAPSMSLPKLFWYFFYNFGLFAWGGPVAQIALIKQQIVVQENWISIARFQRVFAVYQILPGPEAAELCMFFGCLSAGRLGGVVAGLGFILPGFVLMLLASYLYTLAGLENRYFNASFRALQPVVGAMIFKATHKIAEHSVVKHGTARKVDPFLIIIAICTAINSALRLNIFISLFLYGTINMFLSRRLWLPAGLLFTLQYVGYALYAVFRGVPSPVSLALGIAKTPTLPNLFLLGLVAGTLSFGGAYTAIPFVQVEAVLKGGWLPQRVFIDCIALGNVLPAPLVIFATFVGFQGGNVHGGLGTAFAGAVVITLGMFFPCFLFTIAGHDLLEKLVHNKFLSTFFDGLCASVVGVIAVIFFQILRSSIAGTERDFLLQPVSAAVAKAAQAGIAAVLFMVSLVILYKFTNKWTTIVLIVSGAVAGQFLFLEDVVGGV